MKLYLNNASPYARLVLVVAHEKRLAGRIELVWTDPWASEAELLAITPLARVPVLIAEDGEPIVESASICEYLDDIGSGSALLPRNAPERLAMLRKAGLGRGLMDVAIGAVLQKRHAAGDGAMLETRWRDAAARTAASFERLLTLGTAPDLGDLTIAVALGYLDFRMPQIAWRKGAPRLGVWFEKLSKRESMKATTPQ